MGRRRAPAEAGTALVGTLVGFAIVFVLLLFCTQVVLRLYATSALSAAAFDAARQVALSPIGAPDPTVAVAEADARRALGGMGAAARFEWVEVDGQQVVLRVDAAAPEVLPVPPSFRRITRTVVVRTERFR